MVMKAYQCQDCDHEFQRPDDEEPRCPSCDSKSVTFEEIVEHGFLMKTWLFAKPFLQYLFVPWVFYRNRGIKQSIGIFLVMVLMVGMFGAYYQATLVGDPPTEELGAPGSFYVLKTPSILFESISGVRVEEPDRTSMEPGSDETSGLTTGQIGVLYSVGLAIELYWAGILIAIMGWDCFRRRKEQLGALLAGTVWIPNLVFAAVQIVYLRGIQYDLFKEELWEWSMLPVVHVGVSAWLLYLLLGGLFSLPISIFSYVKRLILTVFLQVFGVYLILYVSKLYVFPFVDLPTGVVGDILFDAFRYCGWPFTSFMF